MRRAAAIVSAVLVVAVFATAGWWVTRELDPRVTVSVTRANQQSEAVAAGRAFLDAYTEPDGRVVRRDEGADVVSEGQAYAMLVAAAIGDEHRFRAVWTWTADNLRRPDGLLSWRWLDGRVTDVNSAADADLDAARALVVAGRRFDAPELTADGVRLASAIADHENAMVGTGTSPRGDLDPVVDGVAGMGRVLTAGNWTTSGPSVINPGYFSPRAEQDLLAATADLRWADMTRTHRVIGWQLIATGSLPPDWARVDAAGAATATGPVSGGPARFGLDAARMPVRYAESCDPQDRSLAIAMRPLLDIPGDIPALRNLDGTPASDWQHPVALIAAAATVHADGDADGTELRLDRAAALEQKYPTYYGAAWVALGRIMLTTPLLGQC